MELPKMVMKATYRQTVAHWISIIVHPVAFPLLTVALLTNLATNSWSYAARITFLGVALTALPVAALVVWQVSRGHWTDLDVSVRRQRYALYPVGLLCMALMIGVFVAIHAPRLAIGLAIALGLASSVDGLINFVYKVSAHATGAAVCAAFLWFVPGWGIPATLAAILVGWSRVELGRHTRGQVLLGWGVGLAGTLAALFTLLAL
ncbi:MAG TPA: hypothetical protein VMV29_23095 [Ktedonobacterales bacterium]|nr:hypothetical protein [Ktedonobacterales bacterium]